MVRQVSRNVHQASGEQLLLQAIFGSQGQRRSIRSELDHRSLSLSATEPAAAMRPNDPSVRSTVAA